MKFEFWNASRAACSSTPQPAAGRKAAISASLSVKFIPWCSIERMTPCQASDGCHIQNRVPRASKIYESSVLQHVRRVSTWFVCCLTPTKRNIHFNCWAFGLNKRRSCLYFLFLTCRHLLRSSITYNFCYWGIWHTFSTLEVTHDDIRRSALLRCECLRRRRLRSEKAGFVDKAVQSGWNYTSLYRHPDINHLSKGKYTNRKITVVLLRLSRNTLWLDSHQVLHYVFQLL